jgi:RHS repeat-associated protein
MLKAVDGADPIELNADEAREIARVLLEFADLEQQTEG